MKKLLFLSSLMMLAQLSFSQISVSEVQNALDCTSTVVFEIYGSNDCRPAQNVATYTVGSYQTTLYTNTGNYDSLYAVISFYGPRGCFLDSITVENGCNTCTFGYPKTDSISLNYSDQCFLECPELVYADWSDCNAVWVHN